MAFPPESFKKTKHHKLFSEFTWTYVNSFEIQISTKQLLFAQLDHIFIRIQNFVIIIYIAINSLLEF